MKILFCIDGLFNSGGMEKVLVEKVNYFAENYNYDCIIITTDQNDKKIFFDINKNIIHEDLGINYLENTGNILKRTINFLENKILIKKSCKKK